MNVTKNLGEYNSSESVYLGVKAPYTGTYTFEIEILGVQDKTNYTAAFADGDDMFFVNGLNESAVARFRVKYPSGDQDDGVNYLTTSIGEILFEYRNVNSG